ncbi:hypothetical protein GGF46_004207 [Coemansia sp. RSA 552]|nr:hypothetical protein GGF46_004207 [Coemansia sp. RSA 552]
MAKDTKPCMAMVLYTGKRTRSSSSGKKEPPKKRPRRDDKLELIDLTDSEGSGSDYPVPITRIQLPVWMPKAPRGYEKLFMAWAAELGRRPRGRPRSRLVLELILFEQLVVANRDKCVVLKERQVEHYNWTHRHSYNGYSHYNCGSGCKVCKAREKSINSLDAAMASGAVEERAAIERIQDLVQLCHKESD